MGAKCCCCRKGFARESDTNSTDSNERVRSKDGSYVVLDDADMARNETRDAAGPSEPTLPSPTLGPSEVGEILESAPIASQGETSNTRESSVTLTEDERLSYAASNILWTTGSFSDPIPNGFYSIMPDSRMKHFESIPTLDVLRAMRKEGLKADVILVDLKEDDMVTGLVSYIKASVQGVNSSTPDKVRRIANLVVSIYANSSQTAPQKAKQPYGSYDILKLGQIKHPSCHNRAVWFKVLADSVGLESKLLVGLPQNLRFSPSDKLFKHLSVVLEFANTEFLVDLSLNPGRLIPMSTDGVYMNHISATRGNVACCLPSNPNSSMHSDPKRLRLGRKNSLKLKQRVQDDDSPPQENVSGSHYADAHDGDSSQSLEHNGSSVQDISQVWNNLIQHKPVPEDSFIGFSDLKFGSRVGNGNFGEVFRGKWNGRLVAIKKFRVQDCTAKNLEDFWNEIFLLSRVQHPNVVKFLGVCTEPPQLALVTECVERGNLYEMIRLNGQFLTWPMKLNMLRDICRGLNHIHKKGIVHRDLKSANCLVAKDWTVKICDFGLSMSMDDITLENTVAGTAQWVAPEVLRGEPLTEKSDIYSFGVVMWELCTVSDPWRGFTDKYVLQNVLKGAKLDIPEGPLRKLIADCWLEPEQRPSCDEILTYLEACDGTE